MFLTTGKS